MMVTQTNSLNKNPVARSGSCLDLRFPSCWISKKCILELSVVALGFGFLSLGFLGVSGLGIFKFIFRLNI